MMKQLTKNRAELLRLFLTNPERSFYIQELGRILGKKPGSFQRTLNTMERDGILVSEYRANARYFKAKKEYPLYEELKSIVFKTVGVVGSIKEILEKIGDIDYSFVYGSYAQKRESYLSDIDIVVIGKPDEDRLAKALDRLENFLKREINYKAYPLRELRKAVKKRDPFLLAILRDKKIMIMGTEDELREAVEG